MTHLHLNFIDENPFNWLILFSNIRNDKTRHFYFRSKFLIIDILSENAKKIPSTERFNEKIVKGHEVLNTVKRIANKSIGLFPLWWALRCFTFKLFSSLALALEHFRMLWFIASSREARKRHLSFNGDFMLFPFFLYWSHTFTIHALVFAWAHQLKQFEKFPLRPGATTLRAMEIDVNHAATENKIESQK